MYFHVITLFPDSIRSYVDESILGRAQKNKRIHVSFYNLRDFTKDKHKTVDDKPYGGGPGMVLKVGPLMRAVDHIRSRIAKRKTKKRTKTIIFSPGGTLFENKQAASYAKKYDHLILISGRYEGIDARVKKILKAEDVSIGPYVLTGGEVPVMVLIDAISRQIPGVLGKFDSVEENRISSHEMYTRPEIFEYKGKKHRVPKVLLSGHQKNIEEWRSKGGK